MGLLTGVGELFIPQACAGCGAAGQVLCLQCRAALQEVPHRVSRQREVGIPVFALGDYTRMRRRLIIAMKEYNNVAVRPYVGAVFAAGIRHLQAAGEFPAKPVLVPAPTRARSARMRGGDPVANMCTSSGKYQVNACLDISPRAVDQSRLGAEERWNNMMGAVRLREKVRCDRAIILVDDVVTTGATLAASAAVLRGAGVEVSGAIVLADAR